MLTDNDGFAQVVSSELSSAKLALLDGWDLWPGGIEVGPDGSVYVSATIQRDPQNGFESRQWAARLTADLVPIWRKQIHPYSADQDAWAERAVFVDDQLWLFGSVTVENDEWTMWTTVTIVDTEGELVDAIEIGFPPSAHKGGTQAHAVWTDGDEVVVGGAMQAFNDGQGWDDGWIASLSAAATINWVAAPAPAATDLTATADRLWVVEGATLHELDRQANPIAQHQLAGTAVGIAVLDEHLIVASSTQTDSTVECFDLQGELIGAEQVYPPDLTTLRARPHEVLLAGEGEDGEYVETILFD